VRDKDELQHIKKKPEFIKILDTCREVKKHGFEWMWVDTICIYKTSWAELSEAINSIYQ
jgi:hypothetical protein